MNLSLRHQLDIELDIKLDKKLVETWIELQKCRRACGNCDDLFWAYLELDKLISNDPNEALLVIGNIINVDNSDVIAENLAAGPLEDLLVRHGESILNAIIDLSTKDQKFSSLLGGVWANTIDKDVWDKIQESVGNKLW